MTTVEFALKCGCTRQCVEGWIRRGLIPGTVFAYSSSDGRMRYHIPDNAVKPTLKPGRPFGGHVTFVSAKRLNPKPDPNMSLREAYAYLRKHLSDQTYGQISQATGYPTRTLREMYDKLHERYYC